MSLVLSDPVTTQARGRKRKPGKRTRSGRLSRSAQAREAIWDRAQRETMEVALEARQRVFGVSERDAMDAMAGSVAGRLCLGGQLSHPQYDAAMKWRDQHQRYVQVIRAPRPPGAMDLNAIRGGGWTAENPRAVIAVMARHHAAVQAIREAQTATGMRVNLFSALNVLVERDVFVGHLVGDLRLALNALVKHWGM